MHSLVIKLAFKIRNALNNLYDKDKILNILKNQYNNDAYFDNNLWIFHKGNFIGFKDDIHKIILNYNK